MDGGRETEDGRDVGDSHFSLRAVRRALVGRPAGMGTMSSLQALLLLCDLLTHRLEDLSKRITLMIYPP